MEIGRAQNPDKKSQRQGRIEKREIKTVEKERTGGERTAQCSVELNLSGLLRSGAFFSLAALTVGALSAVRRFFDSLTCLQDSFTDPPASLFPHPQLTRSLALLSASSTFISAAMDEDYTNVGSDEGDRETTRVWRTWRTVFEMLRDRVRFCSRRYNRFGAVAIL
jgi:hypothetical protein